MVSGVLSDPCCLAFGASRVVVLHVGRVCNEPANAIVRPTRHWPREGSITAITDLTAIDTSAGLAIAVPAICRRPGVRCGHPRPCRLLKKQTSLSGEAADT